MNYGVDRYKRPYPISAEEERQHEREEHLQREVVRIVRKAAQNFYPQRQTQVMNEGWASIWQPNTTWAIVSPAYKYGKLIVVEINR
jgi:stage V sporulation protein R